MAAEDLSELLVEAQQRHHCPRVYASGGVTLENLGLFMEAGVDGLVMGSEVYFRPPPPRSAPMVDHDKDPYHEMTLAMGTPQMVGLRVRALTREIQRSRLMVH